MCLQYRMTYPCGHVKSRWELCPKGKAKNLLLFSKTAHCHDSIRKTEAPDLQDGCGGACLTRPWKCNKCTSEKKQTAWHCTDCNSIRDNSVSTWHHCRCPKHACPEITFHPHFCRKCADKCLPNGPILDWRCCSCEGPVRTFASEMECHRCFHKRCGHCKSR
ncbi:hypothetical protein F4777DRAFT_166802 [Nemania sp. FL0916]|nr:hypothetical protein F4777DRAFT_166802 [Nemania sp. FL0916]